VPSVLRAYGLTDKGPVRPGNEDCFAIDDDVPLLVVADGMGGHNAGEVAARIAVDTIVERCREADRQRPFGFDPGLSEGGNLLRTSVHIANTRVLEAASSSEGCSGMGTTIVAAIVKHGHLSVAHVGDSRFYLFNEGRLRLLTRDDSWMAGMLTENPQADPAMYQHHPMRHALTNVVGAEPRIEVHILEEALPAGSVLLLTTDGVHGVLEHGRIEEVLSGGRSAEEMATTLIDAALARDGRDNCTAVVAQYGAD
jgi:protein phosphatase